MTHEIFKFSRKMEKQPLLMHHFMFILWFESWFGGMLNVASKCPILFDPLLSWNRFWLGNIQVLRQQRGGFVGSENGNFLLIYSTIYADVGRWAKKAKNMLTWMVLDQTLLVAMNYNDLAI